MPEGLRDAIEWLKTNPKVAVSALVLAVLVGVLAGRWLAHADDCHHKGEVAFDGMETLTRIHEDALLQQQAKDKTIAEMCIAGELPDKPVTCARALAAVGASR